MNLRSGSSAMDENTWRSLWRFVDLEHGISVQGWEITKIEPTPPRENEGDHG
jgi:hypothetical protein